MLQWYTEQFELKAILASVSKETWSPLPLRPRRIWIRGLSCKRLSQRTLFDLYIGQGKLLFTKGLLFLTSCNDLLKSPRNLTSPLYQDVLCTSITLSTSELLTNMRSLTLILMGFPRAQDLIRSSLLNLPPVDLTIQPTTKNQRMEGGIFPFPHNI